MGWCSDEREREREGRDDQRYGRMMDIEQWHDRWSDDCAAAYVRGYEEAEREERERREEEEREQQEQEARHARRLEQERYEQEQYEYEMDQAAQEAQAAEDAAAQADYDAAQQQEAE